MATASASTTREQQVRRLIGGHVQHDRRDGEQREPAPAQPPAIVVAAHPQ
jgi:hypothetical protein